MKIVIDTNILISGSDDDHNYGSRIINAVLDGSIQAFANPQTVRENKLIANRKISDLDYLDKLNQFFGCIQEVAGQYLNVVEDAEDNKILASAVAAGADFLITADWHLLKIGEFEGVKIITAQGFWAEFESQTSAGWQKWVSDFMN
jgi:putative PIN family toxin of toxin-antitoxin system